MGKYIVRLIFLQIESKTCNKCSLHTLTELHSYPVSTHFPASVDTVDKSTMRVSSMSELHLSLLLYLPSGNSISCITRDSYLQYSTRDSQLKQD